VAPFLPKNKNRQREIGLQADVVQLQTELQDKGKELGTLQIARGVDFKELERLKNEYQQSNKLGVSLKEQLRIADRIQSEQTKELRSLRAELGRLGEHLTAAESERDQAKAALDEREARLSQLQSEWGDLRREFSDAQIELQRRSLGFQENEQMFIVERQGYKSKLDRLQRDFNRLQEDYRRVNQDLDLSGRSREDLARLQKELERERAQATRLKADLRDREQVLEELSKQVEPLGLLPQEGAGLISPLPLTGARLSSISAIKITRVNESQAFIFFSMKGPGQVIAGSSYLLSSGDQLVAEVEVADVDRSGLAMGYILRKLTPTWVIQNGDYLSIRPLIKTSSEKPLLEPAPVLAGAKEREY